MKVRWFKNGKLDKYFEIKPGDNIVVGSRVFVGKVFYYQNRKDLDFMDDAWTVAKVNEYCIVKKVKFIETPNYTGKILKMKEHWPWFQITGISVI